MFFARLQKLTMLYLLICVLSSTIAASKALEKEYCVSLQGNGRAIYSQFGALAYLVESYGVPQGLSGGSSSSVTMFVLESILENPALQDPVTGQVDLTDSATIAKVAFLLKSIIGLGNYMDDSVFAAYLGHHKRAASIGAEVLKAIHTGDLSSFDLQRLYADIKELSGAHQSNQSTTDSLFRLHRSYSSFTSSSDTDAWLEWLKNYGPSFLNEETLFLLSKGIAEGGMEGPGVQWFLGDMTVALTVGAFQFRDIKDFLRPFPVSFEGVARLFGSVGDFYAGNSFAFSGAERNEDIARKRFEALFAACDVTNTGLWVGSVYADGGANTAKCSAVFESMLKDHFGDSQQPEKPALEFRVPARYQRRNATIGTNPALSVLPVVAMAAGQGAKDFIAAKQAYNNLAVYGNARGKEGSSARGPKLSVRLAAKDLQFGYFASQAERDELEEYFAAQKQLGLNSEGGLKTLQSRVLRFHRGVTWERVLTSSPAEPTIATFQTFSAEDVEGGPYASLSGWGGLFDVFPLKALGCKKNVFVTTRQFREEGMQGFEFPLKITKALLSNQSSGDEESEFESHAKQMYSLDAGDDVFSSHERNLGAADLVMCTNWNQKWGMDYNLRVSSFRDAYLKSSLVGPGKSGGLFTTTSGTGNENENEGGVAARSLRTNERSISGKEAPIGCQK